MGLSSSNRHHFIYKRIVNGLFRLINVVEPFYILVIEAINDEGIHWSFIAKVKKFLFMHMIYPPPPSHKLLSFEEVIKFPVPK